MYLPRLFAVDDLNQLHDFIDQHSFATIVTSGPDSELIASHIPILLDRGISPDGIPPYGVVRGHVAIHNPQLEHFKAGAPALVIFQGPHTYVSPSWYAKAENVPTWNYTAVHAYGVPEIGGRDSLIELLKDLAERHESGFERPWTFDPDAPWIQKSLPEIAPFRIKIEKLEGKFKLNQNRTAADRAGVIQALSQSEDPMAQAVSELMQAMKPR